MDKNKNKETNQQNMTTGLWDSQGNDTQLYIPRT